MARVWRLPCKRALMQPMRPLPLASVRKSRARKRAAPVQWRQTPALLETRAPIDSVRLDPWITLSEPLGSILVQSRDRFRWAQPAAAPPAPPSAITYRENRKASSPSRSRKERPRSSKYPTAGQERLAGVLAREACNAAIPRFRPHL